MLLAVTKICRRISFSEITRHYSRLTYAVRLQKNLLKISETNLKYFTPITYKNNCLLPFCSPLESHRYYAKKKKTSKQKVEEEEEESNYEDEELESLELDEVGSTNLITKTVPSLRIDNIVKNALHTSKKKVEKEFYASRIRLNGEKVLKKAINVHIADEVDLVKGYSPENQKFLVVDRIIIKGIGKVTQNGNFPVKMELLKDLTIENYPDSWSKTDVLEDP